MKFAQFVGCLPPGYGEALAELLPGRDGAGGDIRVEGYSAPGPEVQRERNLLRIGWHKPVQFYRALSLAMQNEGDPLYSRRERPCFEVGVLIDASRNAVPSPAALRSTLRKLALMGMDCAMLYTEDTYEVEGRPYFGYMRGRYSREELRALDDYAALFGIELIPCIQTLGHMNRVLHWPAMQRYADNGEVLLADSEETYDLLRDMLRSVSSCFRTRRIHIGMDEAQGIGLGAHLRRRGYENPHDIIRRHLLRVKSLCDELGLRPMMWGDMYFRPDSPGGGYYDTGDPSPESIASVVPGVQLVYWDYYHNEVGEYAANIEKHRKLCASPAFAGGIWTWTGPAPDYDKTLTASVAGLTAAKNAKLPLCFGCCWGDNGAEANLSAALLGMQLYAEFAYTGGYDAAWLSERFAFCCGARAQWFLDLSAFNTVPGMRSVALRPVNAAKFLLYQDPLIQLFAGDTRGYALSAHYDSLARRYAGYAQEARGGDCELMLRFYAALAGLLTHKCRWHERSIELARSGDREGMLALSEELEAALAQAASLRRLWWSLWDSTNKPYGFEVIDGRMGALEARLQTALERVKAWGDGGEEGLPELLETVLPYTLREGGALFGSYAVGEIVSACKIDN